MEQGKDFTIEPFKPRKHGPRSDKGRTHNYPISQKVAINHLLHITMEKEEVC